MKNGKEKASPEDVALFRYGAISPLLHEDGPVRQRIVELSRRRHLIPGSDRTRVAPSTIADWLRAYRRGGFEALKPKRRSDRGQPRGLSADAVEILLAVKRDMPHLSVRLAIIEARRNPDMPAGMPLPPSTVHRLFAREGLMARDEAPPAQDRRRFAYEFAGELWMSDVMHGPKVRDSRGRARRTYLIAFIDDATRVVPWAAFALSEGVAAFLPVLRGALLRRGIPQRLYCDNGAAFRSRQLSAVCARLGIALIHATPRSPAGKGKIERWFRTVREQFLPGLSAQDAASLEALNRRLHAWVEGEYHHAPHRGLDRMTPLDKWASCGDRARRAAPGLDLDDMFLFEDRRLVRADRTVSLKGRHYEVEAHLVGRNVVLRHDPAAPPGRPLKVVSGGRPAGEAIPLDQHGNARARRQEPENALSFRSFDLPEED